MQGDQLYLAILVKVRRKFKAGNVLIMQSQGREGVSYNGIEMLLLILSCDTSFIYIAYKDEHQITAPVMAGSYYDSNNKLLNFS